MSDVIRRQIRQLALPFGLIALLVILFANRLALTNLILGQGDAFLYFYPYWTVASEALQAGRVPLWNPDIFMGAPFLANSQVGFFYPLNWPLWYLLPAPYAVSATLVIHLIIAGWGAFLAARRVWVLDKVPAGISAILFTLGGYITAQVEHVNQVQVMAWLPWFFVALQPRLRFRSRLLFVALLFGLQLTAGHTQTTFITGVGVGLWLLLRTIWPDDEGFGLDVRKLLNNFGPMLIGAFVALLLAAIQLLPTLELTGQSSRAGGLALNEVLSFSLHPLLLSRSLLPGYGQSPFAEYVAFMPLTALLLAGVGLWRWRQEPRARELLVLLLISLFMAFGQFNPFNQLLARLPGFDLFRVPARWLLLYTLAVALLAGLGWQRAQTMGWQRLRKPLVYGSVLLVGLMAWAYASVPLSQIMPVGPESPAEYPTTLTMGGWLLELLLFWAIVSRSGLKARYRAGALLAMLGVVLFLSTRILAYNDHVTTPDIYFQLRPPIARLQALTAGQEPAGRYLSQSQIFFDLGDQAELDTIYADQLDESGLWTYTVATKQKEVIAPNLSMVYGLSSVDGFDGGILPLADYTEVSSLLLPDGFESTDGRLREYIEGVPDEALLDLFGVQYLITDKVGDEWYEAEGLNVFYDRKHEVVIGAESEQTVGHVPAYEATAFRVLATHSPTSIEYTDANNNNYSAPLRPLAANQFQADFAVATTLTSITILNDGPEELQLLGLALIDSRDNSFQTLVPGAYRLLYSGDVKIYENLDVLPRAYVVDQWQAVGAGEATTPGFSRIATPLQTQESPSESASRVVRIVDYRPEAVTVTVDGMDSGLLVVADAHFPDWEVMVNGETAELLLVDGLFRGVEVPAGEVLVAMVYRPVSYQRGRALTIFALIGVVLLFGWTLWTLPAWQTNIRRRYALDVDIDHSR